MNRLDRREFLKAAGLGAASLATGGCLNASRTIGLPSVGKKPNIIFIMVDDLGPEWVGCYGAEDIKTPNIDRLAAGGMQFSNAYSMAQCTPTRAALLTGRYPWRNGWVNHWDVPRWGVGCHFDPKYNMTFARVLKSAGYVTAAAGKWQINDFRLQPQIMKEHGFDEYCMWTGGEGGNLTRSKKRYWDPYIHTKDGSKTYKGRFGEDVFSDFLIDFMRRNKNKPMMLYYPMCLTHTPFTSTPAEPNVTGKYARHKAMVRYADYILGKIVKALDELAIRNNTIIFWTSDNGTVRSITGRMNGRAVKGGKASLAEAGVREPFIVNCPSLVPAGVKTDALTDFTDMMPTFAELAGAKLPGDVIIDGRSIAKLILGKKKDSDRRWIMAMGFGPAKIADGRVRTKKTFTDRVVRDKRYKLWVENGKSSKLFDLLSDPAEKNNIIDSPDPKVAAARAKLEAVVQSFPRTDASPKYDPTPPQPWDRKPKTTKKSKKKTGN